MASREANGIRYAESMNKITDALNKLSKYSTVPQQEFIQYLGANESKKAIAFETLANMLQEYVNELVGKYEELLNADLEKEEKKKVKKEVKKEEVSE